MLVALRLCIGWHFFSEGVKHLTDPHWTSEPVLRSATGPFAQLYHSYVPDVHGFEHFLHAETSQSPEHTVQAWIDEIQKDWDDYRQQFALHFDFDAQRNKQAVAVLQQYQSKLRSWATDNKDSLATHVHEWQRKASTREAPDGNLPFQRKRLAEKQALLTAEAGGWTSEIRALERDYENALDALADDARPPMPPRASSIDLVDGTMTYVILGTGLLLLLGLFTRVACVAGAIFLLSVVMMQPFWVSGAAPTYNQYVEMFALLALATTQVGRWAGLDFFLANLISRPCCSVKGKTDVSES